MTAESLENRRMLDGEAAAEALLRVIARCRRFARAIPAEEDAQARELRDIIALTGGEVRAGALRPAADFAGETAVARLRKEAIGGGRLKLQLFSLAEGESHPPHAHHNLLSCQIVLRGRARMREYTLLERTAEGELKVREEPVKELEPGDGVFTLQRRNNIHWQTGLAAGTVLLNINWRGFFQDSPVPGANSLHGRRHIDWDKARPGGEPGTHVVPEAAERAAQ